MGNNSSWTEYYTDISSLAGNSNVSFRFVFKSDAFVIDVGIAIDDFEIDGPPNSPLPVELVSFTGAFIKEKVVLKWQTKTEIDNYGFEVQRSAFSVQSSEWGKIGFVEGHGNSNSPKFYSFSDGELNGLSKVKYRLKQIDTDGSFTYSDEIEVDITPVSFVVEQNYPNPFNPSTTIKYSLPVQSKVVIKIYNSLGGLVDIIANEVQEVGIYKLTWDASRFSSGVYFYSIEAREENGKKAYKEVKKMLLLK